MVEVTQYNHYENLNSNLKTDQINFMGKKLLTKKTLQ